MLALPTTVCRAAEVATSNPSLSQYYAPIVPGHDPVGRVVKALEMEPVATSVDELRTMLEENAWRTVFHCAGASMTAKVLAQHGYADGWIADGTQLTFTRDTYVMRDIPAGSKSGGPRRTEAELLRNKGTYKIVSKGACDFTIELSNGLPLEVKTVRVNATGERALDWTTALSMATCDGKGTRVRSIMAPESAF